jgi:hypothetical protein
VAGQVTAVLHGRKHELLALDALVDAVPGGSSAAVVLRGEAGIGKTSLLQHVAYKAERSFRLARIAGVESEMEIAFPGLQQLCAPMLDRLAVLPSPQRAALNVAFGIETGTAPDRRLIGLATLGLLAQVASERPLMCLIDDGQWLDEACGGVVTSSPMTRSMRSWRITVNSCSRTRCSRTCSRRGGVGRRSPAM